MKGVCYFQISTALACLVIFFMLLPPTPAVFTKKKTNCF